jgi:hypothetical protein
MSLDFLDREMLTILDETFDAIWSTLEPVTNPAICEASRNIIRTALLQAAKAGERDPEKLWCHAMARARALSTLYWMTTQAPQSVPSGTVGV